MATSITNTKPGINLGEIVKVPFHAIGRFLVAVADSASRAREIEELTSMTDTQLARRGLARTDIVRYVFRDRMGI